MTDWSNSMDRSRGKCMDCMDRSSCMMDWGSCMVSSWCNMEGCGVVWDCHRMDGGGVVEGGCMVGNRMMDGGSMVSNSMVGCSMVDPHHAVVHHAAPHHAVAH